MSEKMSRSELSHQDKKLIEDILLKSPEKLDAKEKAVLRSRRSYLSTVEERVFAEVLEDKKEVVEAKEEKKKPGRRKK